LVTFFPFFPFLSDLGFLFLGFFLDFFLIWRQPGRFAEESLLEELSESEESSLLEEEEEEEEEESDW
jgi:hypothetical protein